MDGGICTPMTARRAITGPSPTAGSVAVTTITPVNQITDLGVAIAASTNQVILGSNVTFTITVTNSGTNATNVFLTNVLGAGLSFVSNTLPRLRALSSKPARRRYYNLGILAGQTNLTLGFVADATAAGLQTSTANIGSSLIDPNTNNNQAVASVTVVLPTADVSAAISSSAARRRRGRGEQRRLHPHRHQQRSRSGAQRHRLVDPGRHRLAGTVFSNNFGGIAPGSIATALFTNAPAVAGSLTNTWTVSTGSTDTNPANNTATLVLAVTYPEPVIVANGVRLLSESSRAAQRGG